MTATTTHKLSHYRSLYSFDPRTIHLNNNYELSSATAEEWLDRITTVQNYIHDVLKQINHKQSNLYVEKAKHFNIDDWVLVDGRNL